MACFILEIMLVHHKWRVYLDIFAHTDTIQALISTDSSIISIIIFSFIVTVVTERVRQDTDERRQKEKKNKKKWCYKILITIRITIRIDKLFVRGRVRADAAR